MTPNDVLEKAISYLNETLCSHNRSLINNDSVLFSFEKHVSYEHMHSHNQVTVSQCYGSNSVRKLLEDRISGGPNWIHASLLIGEDGQCVILFDFGSDIGITNSPINTSYVDRALSIGNVC